ncbi:TonB-dependent receptor [Sphingomonas sp. BK235]|uniref:TonB-dependent receptor n=1 Tax=Sphingomonas sp. BK235 TaxID=2512131 RepID=UPI0010E50181|nr:TonB-dependent receptor [Sphingomonas sp. BK235]TCP29863.1 TonB-dependent receptor [Sphingomonas sp. BK235]
MKVHRTLRSIALGGTALAACGALPAAGQLQRVIPFDVPAQDLGQALTRLGRQAGEQIVFTPQTVAGRHANPVRGSMTSEQALQLLLRGSGLAAHSGAGGGFVIGGYMRTAAVVAQQQAAPLAAQGTIDAVEEPEQAVDDVVVLGVRGAQRAAIDIKRNAPQIVDSIVAEDIGKLPDTTIADSLQRVPGVQIGRSAGEGSTVNIRGLPQVLVTLNGEQFLGGQGIINAQPDLSDIPPTLFSGVDVFKSPTASQLEGGVSGTISLKTRRPFDLTRGLTAAANVEGNYGSRTKKLNELYSALVGWHGERWGALLSGSYSNSTLANISYDAGNSWRATTAQGTPFSPAAGGAYYYQPDVVTFSNQSVARKRYGLNGSAQVLIGSAFTLTGDAAYNRLENRTRNVGVQFNSGYNSLALLGGSQVDENGVVQVGSFSEPRWRTSSYNRPATSEAYNTNLELKYDAGERLKATVRWVHGKATNNYEQSFVDSLPTLNGVLPRGGPVTCGSVPNSQPGGECVYANPNGFPAVVGSIDYTGKYPKLGFVTDVSNPANYSLTSTWADGVAEESKLDAFRADISYDTTDLIPFITSFDYGGRYGKRDVRHREFRYLAPGRADLTSPADLYYYKDAGILHQGPTVAGYSILPLLPFPSVSQYVGSFSNFGPLGGVPAGGIPAIDPRAMDDPLAFQNALFPGNVAYDDPTRTFRVEEKTSTAYVQANFRSEQGILGMPFGGNVGVRVIGTNRTIHSFLTNPTEFIGTNGNWNGVILVERELTATKKYTDWLPSANLTFDVASDQRARFAFAKVVGALNLFDIGAGANYYYGVNGDPPRIPGLPFFASLFTSGNSGNPDLEPYRSTNYNASYEWYFGRGGLLSVGAFLFKVKSFPQTVTQIQPIPDQDGVVRLGGPVTTTANGGGGTIKGLEFGYQQQFDFLPGLLSGFGINANYTYSDSQSSNTDLNGEQTPVPDNSKHQYNIIGLYQKGAFQGRVAYNWRSERFVGFQTIQNSNQSNLAIWAKPQGYLDASVSYDITPKLTVYAQGTNLTNEFEERYLQFPNQFYLQNLFERRIFAGVRVRL